VKKAYLDTSAFFKVFVEEERETSDTLERIFELVKEKKISIVLSDWVINESFALADKNNRNGRITHAEAQQILSELISMIKAETQYETITFYSITEKIVVASRLVIQEYHIGASDALHVFISAAAECDFFISADKKLVRNLSRGTHKLAAYDIKRKEDIERMFREIMH
jgi:predicted nucleic acid-binding protein